MSDSQVSADSTASVKPLRFSRIGLLLICMLLPFAGKAIHIDDTVFVGIARHILNDPLHPYRFDLNWLGQPESLWVLTLHPPLHCYLLAVPCFFAGINELALHLFCYGLALGCAGIMFSLAQRFCKHAALATLLSVLTPAFFVSATTLMADISMLFFWLLAIRCAVWAVDSGKISRLWWAAISGSAAAMTKYFAIAIVPLLFVYVYVAFGVQEAVADRQGGPRHLPRGALIPFLIICLPLTVMISWGIYSQQQEDYGYFHPFAAAHFSTMHKSSPVLFSTARTTLSYLGSVLVWPLLLLPVAVKLPRWLQCLSLGILVTVVFTESTAGAAAADNLISTVMYTITAATGTILLAVCTASIWQRRDTDSLLLGLWCFGTIAFAAFFNWCVNARVLVPAIFPAGLLVIRWIEGLHDNKRWLSLLKYGLWPVAVLTLALAFADYQFAAAGKRFAQTTVRELIRDGETVTFAGHWGFQFYMEQEGARALDHYGEFQIAGVRAFEEKHLPKPGEFIVYPTNNSGLESRSEIEELLEIELISQHPSSSLFGLHLMSGSADAGFYSSVVGRHPYGISSDGSCDRFTVYRVVATR